MKTELISQSGSRASCVSGSNVLKISGRLILTALVIFFSSSVFPYEFEGNKWIGGKATIYANIPGISNSGITWSQALLSAALEWNQNTVFNLTVLPIYRDPCVPDGLNSVKFATDLCGQKFNDATIAVTTLKYKAQQLGPPAIIEADIFVRDDLVFDVYDGELLQTDKSSNTIDFKRTVLHELGHVIGLGHEELQTAVMQPKLSDIFSLQPDDITGANKLYTGISNCEVKELRFGKISDSLNLPDCSVRDLTLGGLDNSLIDLYRFKTTAPTQVDFAVDSEGLESVLIIADSDLNYIAIDSDVSGGCGASLKTQLDAGEYFLMVNTFDIQVKQQCKLVGGYELIASYSGKSPVDLNLHANSSNTEFNSKFFGSITADQGETYGNLFSSRDSLDISASITIDPSHRGKDGFIAVAAVIGNQVMLLNENGQFIDFPSAEGSIIPALWKNFEEVETIDIAKNLVAEEFNIKEIAVDFFIGYGLKGAPERIFSHKKPFNLTITEL